MTKKSANLFTIVVFLILAGGLLAQDKTSPEAYSGVAIGTGGSVGGKTIQFDFRVTQYTTDEELLVRVAGQPVNVGGGARCWATAPTGGPQGCGVRINVTLGSSRLSL